MACAHTTDEHCPICAVTQDGAPSLDDSVNDTLVRAHREASAGNVPKVLAAGVHVGRYIVLERLGQGGMGTVVTAHDPQLQRVVAVKVLSASMAQGKSSSSSQARLLREAQAMAQVAHPNVVQVYDSGPFGEGVFIAMELVRGPTLEHWMKKGDKKHWRQVLSTFIDAGRGLEAAHARGLIHRDFKPANVLLGEDGRARVTDFGLARATRPGSISSPSQEELDDVPEEVTRSGPRSLDTPLTQAGAMMGTPGYMAPEQYDGLETTEATDQFSFCVTLYEALYGARPFPGKTLPDLAVSTRAGVVPPPPKGSDVPAWVHRIVEKGLSVRVEDRHASMQVLLAALLDDPALRRTRRGWVAAGVVAAGVLFGVGAYVRSTRSTVCAGFDSVMSARWNADARRRAEEAFVATKVPFAKASWVLTREALDVWAREWVAARTEACVATRVRGEQTERQLLLRAECLDRRLTEFTTLTAAFAQADAKLVSSAGTAAAAMSPLATCANVKQLEDRRAPPPELQHDAATIAEQVSRGRALSAANRLTEARTELESASGRATELKLPALEAEAREAFGELEVLERKFSAAQAQFELAVRAAERAADDTTAARILSRMVSIVGWRLARPDQARTWAALASGIVERIGGDTLTEARIQEGLGDAEWQDGRRALSLDAYRKALALYRKVEGDESLDVARLRSAAGWVLTEQGELADAKVEIDESRVLRERLLGPGHPALSDTWNDLGLLASEQRDYAEAIRCEQMAVEISGSVSSRQLASQMSLAMMEVVGGKAKEGLALANELRERINEDDTPASVIEYGRVHVQALARLGRFEEAMTEGRTTLAEQERKLGKLQPEVAAMADVLGEVAMGLKRWDEAIALSERYLAMKAAIGGVDSPRTGETLLRSAQAHLALGRAVEAAPRAERALAALERGKLDRSLHGEARRVLAMALKGSGADAQRVDQLLQQAKEDALAAGDEALMKRLEP